MTTLLNKTVKREVRIRDQAYIVAISPLTLKLTPKGKRKGLELHWDALVSGDAALAMALNASLGKFTAVPAARELPPQPAEKGKPATKKPKIGGRSRKVPHQPV